VTKVRREQPVPLERQVLRGHKEFKEKLVMLVLLAQKVHKDL
jgi:hypothetical protein